MSSQPKMDDSPPPPYTLTDEAGNTSNSARPDGPSTIVVVTPPTPVIDTNRPISPFQRPIQIHGPTPFFGPTPLQQTQPLLLPYYDPRSSYSLSQADNRARWRFVGAVLWTIVLWVVVGALWIAWLEEFRFDWDGEWEWGRGGGHADHRHGQAPTSQW